MPKPLITLSKLVFQDIMPHGSIRNSTSKRPQQKPHSIISNRNSEKLIKNKASIISNI